MMQQVEAEICILFYFILQRPTLIVARLVYVTRDIDPYYKLLVMGIWDDFFNNLEL
jgi:hypothetical protein